MVRRYDRGELKKPKRMDNGWLRVEGHLTRTGVFTYLNADGSKRRELRLSEEVFRADALDSFALVPVTDEHPPEFLTAENTTQYQRGSVGEQVVRDTDHVRGQLCITDKSLALKMDRGEAVELSCGYTCDLEERPGEFQGEKYDCIQRNIRGNHVAVVPRGRAGPTARVRMDAESAVMLLTDPGGETPPAGAPPKTEETPVAFKVRVDGIDVEVATEQGAQLIAKQSKAHEDALAAKDAEIKKLRTELETTTAKRDALAEEVKKKEDALKAAPEKIRAEMKGRVDLEAAASKVLGKETKFDGLTDRQIREKVLAKSSPDLKLDGKSDEYVAARFDLAIEKADANEDDDREDAIHAARRAAEVADEGDDGEDKRVDSTTAYKRMVERNRKAWQPKTQAEK